MRLIFILMFVCASGLVFAKDTKEIVVATESWKGATNHDGSGLYWDIMKRVYEPLGYTIVKKHTSYEESVKMVKNGDADLYLGSYIDEHTFVLYPKYYFDQDIVIAVFNTEAIDKWEGKKSLRDMNVGWVRGYDFDKYLNVKVHKKEFSTRNNGLKLLKNQRLDAFVDDRDDIKPYLVKAKLDPEYFKQKIIMQLKLYPAFSNNVFGQKLKTTWDKQMGKLIQTEAFKELYFNSEYAIFPY